MSSQQRSVLSLQLLTLIFRAPLNANCLIALDGTFGTNGCAPVAVADAGVVLSQGLCSSGVSAALPSLQCIEASHTKKNNVESVGFFIICVEMVLRL
jgi:hypothetical protein